MARAANPTTPKPRRVVGYVRISKDRANETSTGTQEESIRAYCVARGWDLVKIISEPGRSAFKASRKSRPGFREARQLIATGVADAFVVWKIDRAARNALDLLQLVEELDEAGAEFASVTEQFDTTSPMGEAMLTIIGALARLESAQKSDRATEWHRHRRITAAVPAGPAALGYRKPAPNTLEPDPEVAPLVRQAAENIAGGASVLSQTKVLATGGVKVSHVGLRVALLSPTLAGLAAVSDGKLDRQGGVRVLDDADLVAGEWEAILDRDLWERVRVVLSDPSRSKHVRPNRLKYALAPIARCHCGSKMHVHIERWNKKGGTGEMPRLLCDDTKCATGIGYDAVEAAVTAAVLDLLDDDTWNMIRAGAATEEPDTAAVEAKLARMWDLVLDGKLEPEEFAEAKTRWRGELAAATTQPVDLPDVADVRAAWPAFDAQERHLVFRAAIKHLVIKPAVRRGGRGVDLSRVDLELA